MVTSGPRRGGTCSGPHPINARREKLRKKLREYGQGKRKRVIDQTAGPVPDEEWIDQGAMDYCFVKCPKCNRTEAWAGARARQKLDELGRREHYQTIGLWQMFWELCSRCKKKAKDGRKLKTPGGNKKR